MEKETYQEYKVRQSMITDPSKMDGENLLKNIFHNWKGFKFTDVSGSIYEIIDKEEVYKNLSFFKIKVLENKKGEHKVTNGSPVPFLKAEWSSYCVKKDEGIFEFHQQYMTNIVMRGYIEPIQ